MTANDAEATMDTRPAAQDLHGSHRAPRALCRQLLARLGRSLLALGLCGLGAAAVVGCGSADEGEPTVACGFKVCTDQEPAGYDPAYPAASAGKADADSVKGRIAVLTADGVLDANDVAEAFASAGDNISVSEMLAIRDALQPPPSASYTVPEEARQQALRLALVANLSGVEREIVESGHTFAGTPLPEPVRELLARARLNGAVAFDVNEKNSDGEGVWTPYPATTPATDNMAFDYTLITPETLAADLADTTVEYNAIIGEEKGTLPDGRTYDRARYERRKGGTGNVISHYDHVYHPDIYARGSQGQKWANNCGILSDGTVHCLPAARRSITQDLILTNPHLSRGARMLYNGHIDIRAGRVESVEMSGRLSKRAAEGQAVFVDPIAFLQAWGFEMDADLDVYYGNTSEGRPVRDLEQGVIHTATPPTP